MKENRRKMKEEKKMKQEDRARNKAEIKNEEKYKKKVRGLYRDKKRANATKECDFTINSPLSTANVSLTVVEPTAQASEARFPSRAEGGLYHLSFHRAYVGVWG